MSVERRCPVTFFGFHPRSSCNCGAEYVGRMTCGSFICGILNGEQAHFRYALMERMALLQPVAYRPFLASGRPFASVHLRSEILTAATSGCGYAKRLWRGDVVKVLTLTDELLEFGQQGFLQGEG